MISSSLPVSFFFFKHLLLPKFHISSSPFLLHHIKRPPHTPFPLQFINEYTSASDPHIFNCTRTKIQFQFFADIRYALTGSIYIAMSESCCTPAVIYRTSKIPKMLDYFTMRAFTNRSAKDDILDEAPFISRLTDTNLVIHIGYISAIRRRAVTLDVLKQLRYRSQHTFPF